MCTYNTTHTNTHTHSHIYICVCVFVCLCVCVRVCVCVLFENSDVMNIKNHQNLQIFMILKKFTQIFCFLHTTLHSKSQNDYYVKILVRETIYYS